jgi:hypothetical protein
MQCIEGETIVYIHEGGSENCLKPDERRGTKTANVEGKSF